MLHRLLITACLATTAAATARAEPASVSSEAERTMWRVGVEVDPTAYLMQQAPLSPIIAVHLGYEL